MIVYISCFQWSQFFSDLLGIVKQSSQLWTVDMFLRMLLAIDIEVVDREAIHTQEVRLYPYTA